MDTFLELEAKKQAITEARINTANYYQANKCFKYPKVSLMEISYIYQCAQNNVNDDNLCALHNEIIQIMVEKKLSSISNEISHPPYFKTTRMEYWVSNQTAIELLQILKKEPSNTDLAEINTIIENILKQPILNIIKDFNPNYKGDIHNKTSAPHKLIIQIIAIMLTLKIPKTAITWKSIYQFLDKYIYLNYSFKTISELEEVNEDELKVRGVHMSKRNCQNKIAYYKKNIFNLT